MRIGNTQWVNMNKITNFTCRLSKTSTKICWESRTRKTISVPTPSRCYLMRNKLLSNEKCLSKREKKILNMYIFLIENV